MKGRMKKGKKILFAAIAPLVALVIGFSALIGIISAVGTRMRTEGAGALGTTAVSGTTINLGASEITDKTKVDELITYLGGTSYDNLAAQLSTPKTADNFTTKTVTLGGIVWNVVYVSRADRSAVEAGSGVGAKGDVIVTLWQESNDDKYMTKFSNFASTDPSIKYPSNMYGSSLVRSTLVGSQYAVDANTLTNGTQNAHWTPFTSGAFSGYLSTPAQMAWQETQSASAVMNYQYFYQNDAYGTPDAGNNGQWYNSKYNYSDNGVSDATVYSAWKDDKIWLPSMTETGWGAVNKNIYNVAGSGLWNANADQRSTHISGGNVQCFLRSGYYADAEKYCRLQPTGDGTYDYPTLSYTVRPAIHLNLRAVVDSFDGAIELGETGIDKTTSANGVNELITYLGASDYNDLANNLSAPRTADNFTARTVKLGGIEWNIMYVSKADYTANGTNKGDVVVTLWQGDTNLRAYFSELYTDNASSKYVPSMYGASTIRGMLVGSSYSDNGSTLNKTGIQTPRWSPFTGGAFSEYMATPANMEWQKTLSNYAVMKFPRLFPNDAWGTPSEGSYYSNSLDFAQKETDAAATYAAWKDDKIWLPSATETGWGDSGYANAYGTVGSGLWNTSVSQRSSTIGCWTRSGGGIGVVNAVALEASGNSERDHGANSLLAVRPAIHLNLTKVMEEVGDVNSVIDLGESDITDKAQVDRLVKYLGGNSLEDLSDNLTAPLTADLFTTKTVKLGGIEWYVVYVSKADRSATSAGSGVGSAGDVIVTLWQKDIDTNYAIHYGSRAATDTPKDKYPASSYGSSLVRSTLVGSQYAYSGSTLASNNQNVHWKTLTTDFGKFITTPAQMKWQETESAPSVVKNNYFFPNESYGTPSTVNGGTWFNDCYANNGDAATYAAWKDDKIWLPSMTETGWGNMSYSNTYGTPGSGLWNATAEQRSAGTSTDETTWSWLRSGVYDNASQAYALNASGERVISATTTRYAVRPAIHINLTEVYRQLGGDVPDPVPENTYSVTIGDKTLAVLKDSAVKLELDGSHLTITYINGDEEEVSESVSITVPEGHEAYLYYSSDPDKTPITAESVAISGDTEIEFDVKPIIYTITFVPNGATIPSGMTAADFTVKAEYGSTVQAPVKNLTKPANTFLGWYATADFSGGAVDMTNGVVVRGDATYYARWHEDGYALTMHYADDPNYTDAPYTYGTHPSTGKPVLIFRYNVIIDGMEEEAVEYFDYTEAENPDHFPVATPAFTFKNPTAAGFEFAGWYNAAGVKVEGVRKNATRAVEVWARWKPASYEVEFDADGGSVVPKAKYYTNTEAFGSLPTPQKTGYTFAGWYYADEELGFDEITAESVAILKGKTTLVAHWTALKYEINFEVENDEHGNPKGELLINGEGWVSGKKYDYGTTVTLRVTARDGYAVQELQTRREGQTQFVTLVNGAERTIITNLTVKAIYRIQTYTITYTYDGGAPAGGDESGFVKSYSLLSDANTALPGKNDVYKEGYELANWKLKGNDASLVTVGGIRDVLQQAVDEGELRNVILVAKWNPSERNVYLHWNIGSGERYQTVSTNHQTGFMVRTGDSVRIELDGIEEMSNYTLLGWATSQNSRAIAVPVTDNVGYYTVKVETDEMNADLTKSINNLYAVWHVAGQQLPLIMGSDAPNNATEVTYTGNSFNITARPFETYKTDGGAITLRYQWFKDGRLVHTQTISSTEVNTGDENWDKSTYSVTNVSQSGVYTCLLTVSGDISGATATTAEGEIAITVNKANYNRLSFNNVFGVEYDGQLHNHYVLFGADNKPAVNYIEIGGNEADWIKVTYSYELNGVKVSAIRNAGIYTVTATFEVPANSNYNDIEAQTSLYEIEKRVISSLRYEMYNVDGADETLIETESFIVSYNGKKYVIRAVSENILSGDDAIIELSDCEATAVGVYEAALTGVLVGADAVNYEFEIMSRINASRRYEIERAEHDLSSWRFGDAQAVYDKTVHEIIATFGGEKVVNGSVIDGTLTVTYTVTAESFTDGYSIDCTGNGGAEAGVYTITATFTDSDPNFVAVADEVAVLTVVKADFFEAFDREAMLGDFHNDSRGYSVGEFTKKSLSAAGDTLNGMSFADTSKFAVTYGYEQWVNGSYSTIFEGSAAEHESFRGVDQPGNYRITAHIEYADGADGLKNNYATIEDIEIAYTISRESVVSISVQWVEGFDGQRLGNAFDPAAINSISVVYSNGQSETFSGEAVISCEVIDTATGNEITTFGHVGNYSVKVKFLGVESSDAHTLTVRQEIGTITSWEYREAGGSWATIPADGIEYFAGDYEFRGKFDCIGTDGNPATGTVSATASETLNYREGAYTLTAATTAGNYIIADGDGNAIKFEELFIKKNTKSSAIWYYNDGAGDVIITDDTLVYTGSSFNGKIFAKFGTTILEWTVAEGASSITDAGEYKLVATQRATDAPNYKLGGLEKTIKVNPQTLTGSDFTVKYQTADGWVALSEVGFKLTYNGEAYAIKIEMADGKEITVWGVKGGKAFKQIVYGGTYQLVCGAGNYKLADGVVLPQLEITPVTVTVDWEQTEFTYNGEAHTVVGTAVGVVDSDKNATVLELGGAVTETFADTYGVTVKIAEEFAGSYVLAGGQETKSWKILPKEVALDWKITAFAYNGKVQTPEINVAETGIEAVDRDKIYADYTYTNGSTPMDRNDIKNVYDNYGVTVAFRVFDEADAAVLNNYKFTNLSTKFAIVRSAPDLGTVTYAEYGNNVAYANNDLRIDKIDYSNRENVEGTFEFLQTVEGEDTVVEKLSFGVGAATVKYKFTPKDANYDSTTGTIQIMVREDNPAFGENSLLIEIAPGGNWYIVDTSFDISKVTVYQKYTSFYVENGLEYGRKQEIKRDTNSWNSLELTINGKNVKNGYRFTADDLPENEDVGILTLNAVLSSAFRGSAEITLSRLQPKSISIYREDALKKQWYEGEEFDFSDVTFNVYYTDNPQTETPGLVSGSMLSCSISGMTGTTFTADDVGEHVVTFSYFGKECTATINVVGKVRLTHELSGQREFMYTGSAIDWQNKINLTFTSEDGEFVNASAGEIGIELEFGLADIHGNAVTTLVGVAGREETYKATVKVTVKNVKYYFEGNITFDVIVTNKMYNIVFDTKLPVLDANANDDKDKYGYEWRESRIQVVGELIEVTDRAGNKVDATVSSSTYLKDGKPVDAVEEVGVYTWTVTFKIGNDIVTQTYYFSVKQAKNSVSLKVPTDVKWGETLKDVEATADHGVNTLYLEFSTTQYGVYSKNYSEVVTKAEVYWVRAVVDETANYAGAKSEAVRFTVNEVSISTDDNVDGVSRVEVSNDVIGIKFGTKVQTGRLENIDGLNVGNVLEGYELTLENSDGAAVTLDYAVEIKLLISEELKGRTDLNVYFVDAEGNATNMNAKVDGEYLVFTASGLTSGRLAVTYREPGQPIGLIVAVVILGVVAAGMVTACGIVYAKKRRSN